MAMKRFFSKTAQNPIPPVYALEIQNNENSSNMTIVHDNKPFQDFV